MPPERHLLLLSTNDSNENDLSKEHTLSSFQRISCFHLDGCKWGFLNGEC